MSRDSRSHVIGLCPGEEFEMQSRVRYYLLGMLMVCSVCSAGECPYQMYPDQEVFDPNVYTTPNSLCIYPDGRSSLSDAVEGGFSIYYGVLLDVYDYDSGWHHVDYEAQGMQLGNSGATVTLCDTTIAYLRRDKLYEVFGSQTIRGGGHSEIGQDGQPISSVVAYWSPDEYCGMYGMDLFINSPDINGDLVVNMTDTILYSGDLSGGYNYRSDFNWDGVINVTDTAIFAAAIGAHCQ